MNFRDAMHIIIRSRKQTYQSISDSLGLTQSTVSDRVTRGDIKLTSLLELAEVLDYEVVLRSKLTDKNEVVITESNKKKS